MEKPVHVVGHEVIKKRYHPIQDRKLLSKSELRYRDMYRERTSELKDSFNLLCESRLESTHKERLHIVSVICAYNAKEDTCA